MLSKPLLPEWRYWPGVPLGLLMICAVIGSSSTPPPFHQAIQQQPQTKTNDGGGDVTMIGRWFGTWNAEDFIALFTLFTLGVLAGQWRGIWRADHHFRVSERAYVKMSHKPPGIAWDTPESGKFLVDVRVKNFGRTPAEVTDVFLRQQVVTSATASDVPIYENPGERIPTIGFLVTKDDFVYSEPMEITLLQRAQVEAAALHLLLIYGYVDYIDKFGRRHRGGYARMYDANARGNQNNLQIFPHRGYNYDRPRVRGEGNDWPP